MMLRLISGVFLVSLALSVVGLNAPKNDFISTCLGLNEEESCRDQRLEIAGGFYTCKVVADFETAPKRITTINDDIYINVDGKYYKYQWQYDNVTEVSIFLSPTLPVMDKSLNSYYAGEGTSYLLEYDRSREVEVVTSGKYTFNQIAFDENLNKLFILALSDEPNSSGSFEGLFLLDMDTLEVDENNQTLATRIKGINGRLTALGLHENNNVIFLGLYDSDGHGKLLQLYRNKRDTCPEATKSEENDIMMNDSSSSWSSSEKWSTSKTTGNQLLSNAEFEPEVLDSEIEPETICVEVQKYDMIMSELQELRRRVEELRISNQKVPVVPELPAMPKKNVTCLQKFKYDRFMTEIKELKETLATLTSKTQGTAGLWTDMSSAPTFQQIFPTLYPSYPKLPSTDLSSFGFQTQQTLGTPVQMPNFAGFPSPDFSSYGFQTQKMAALPAQMSTFPSLTNTDFSSHGFQTQQNLPAQMPSFSTLPNVDLSSYQFNTQQSVAMPQVSIQNVSTLSSQSVPIFQFPQSVASTSSNTADASTFKFQEIQPISSPELTSFSMQNLPNNQYPYQSLLNLPNQAISVENLPNKWYADFYKRTGSVNTPCSASSSALGGDESISAGVTPCEAARAQKLMSVSNGFYSNPGQNILGTTIETLPSQNGYGLSQPSFSSLNTLSGFQTPGVQNPSFQVSSFQNPSFQSSSFQNPSFQSSSFQRPSFQSPSFQNPNFQSSSFQSSSVQNPSFQIPSFQSSSIQNPSFQIPNFQSSSFQNPSFQSPSFQNPGFQNFDFQNSAFQSAGLARGDSTFKYAQQFPGASSYLSSSQTKFDRKNIADDDDYIDSTSE